MKKVVTILLALLTALLLMSCSMAETAVSGIKFEPPVQADNLDTSSNKVVIYSGAEEYRNEYFMKRLTETFPDYEIVIEYMPTGNLAAKLAAEGTETDMDIFYDLDFSYAGLVEQYLADVSAYDQSIYVDDCKVENARYLAATRNGGAVIINPAVLEAKGIAEPTSYADLLNAVIAALSDELLAKTVGDFTEKDGVYTVPVNVTVDMANLGIMAGTTIQETVIFNLHLFDNCAHPETLPIDAVEPTCTEAGATAGSYCRICGETVIAPEEIPALGHDFDESIEANVTVVPATCTEAGSKTVKCSRCDATNVTTIAAAGHTLEKVEAKEATVTEEGNIEYYKCSVCGKLFADAEGKTELQPADVVIAKLVYTHKGDVDSDDKITTADARLALRRAIGLETYAKDSVEFYRADVNDDGEVKPSDARDILRVSIGLDKPDWAAWWLNADQD